MAAEALAALSEMKDPTVTREQVHSFLTKGLEMMNSDATRETLKDAEAGRPGVKLMELQKAIWAELEVNHLNGKKTIDDLEKLFDEDKEALDELVALRKTFIETAKKVYLQALEDRRPSKLETEAKIPREVILEFFDACAAKMDSEESRAALKAEIKEIGDMPKTALEQIRWECLELLGWEKEHGKSCFGTLQADFPKDIELLQGVERWQNKAKGVCMTLLYEFQQEGGTLNGHSGVKMAVLEIAAAESLKTMTPEARGELLEKNMKKVILYRDMPPEARLKFLDALKEEDRVELMKSDLLLRNYTQQQEKQKQVAQQMAAMDPKKAAMLTQMMQDLAGAKNLDPAMKAKLEEQIKKNEAAKGKGKASGGASPKAKGKAQGMPKTEC
jgi:hypothetical protein